VNTVGFDLYCRILDEAVEELKKGTLEIDENKIDISKKSFTEPKLDLDFDLLIPETYIKNQLERVAVYHRLVNFREISALDDMQLELKDRFGELPEEVILFLKAVALKVLAGYLLAKRLILSGKRLKIIFDEKAQDNENFFNEFIPRLMNLKETKVNFLNEKDLGVQMAVNGETTVDRIEFAKKVLQKVIN
jgi:transcription-repair coupling factor (superfamily II helicase)